MDEKKLYSVKDVQELTGLSRNSVTGLIQRKQLKIIRVGRRILVPRQSIEAFINSAT